MKNILDKMKRELIAISSLTLILLLSGCTDGPSASGCSDNGLNLVNYNVNPLEKIYPGDMVTITFWLENKGGYDAKDVTVNFFDTPGFDVKELECEGKLFNSPNCELGPILSLSEEDCLGEIKEVKATLRIKDTGKKTVSFSVDYNYHGNSKLLFSIWKRGLENQYGQKQKPPYYSPIKVDINSDFLLKRIVDDKTETVTEWVEEGQKFTLKIDARDVSSLGDKSFKKEISPSDFKIKFNYVKPILDENCDLKQNGDYYIPNASVEVPTQKPLKCDVKVDDNINQNWVTGEIEVDYDYKYQLIKKQDFNIE